MASSICIFKYCRIRMAAEETKQWPNFNKLMKHILHYLNRNQKSIMIIYWKNVNG